MITKITGTASCLPPRVVTNDDLSKLMDTSDEWIYTRTGIHERHIAVDETVADMALDAGRKAVESAGIEPEELDLIIAATITGEQTMPGTACRVQAGLGAVNAAAFDISAACSGFLFGLSIADGFIRGKQYRHILVIGAEAMSRAVDWNDRSTCVLFGDGAGAVVVSASDGESGIIDTQMHTDGNGADALYGNDRSRENLFGKNGESDRYIHMEGQEVFRFAVKRVPESIQQMLSANGRTADEIDMFLLHQANTRIISSVAKRLGQDLSKFPVNLEKLGNTSAASIPILLDELNRSGRLKEGKLIMLSGFGGGLSWGTILMKW